MKNLLGLLLILTCTQSFSQDSLQSFNYSRNHITITGMKVLASWGIANIGVGAAGWATSGNGTNKYFYQMSTIWGAANVGAAVLGFTSAKRNLSKNFTAGDNLKAQKKIEKTFIINGALDVVYTGAGIFFNTRGNNRDNDQLKGYGSSLIMQGIFLLVFDGTIYKVQRTNGNAFRLFFNHNAVTFTGNSIGIVHNL